MSGAAYQERMEARKQEFKRGIDGDEARRRREDNVVSIRKNKREDALAKRRQQEVPAATNSASPAQPSKPLSSAPSDIQTWVAKLHVQNYEEALEATTHFRKLLSLEKNPPIDVVIKAGIVPKLVEYCTYIQYPKLQYEAAWALTNIASGTSDQTKVVLDAGAVPVFVKLLQSPDENVREQCIWALGNIAGDGPAHRDMVLRSGALPWLIENLARTSKVSMLRNGTWTLSNFTRGKPQPEFSMVAGALPALAKLLHSTDNEVLTDACWAISYLSDGGPERIEAIIKIGLVPRLVELMTHSSASIQTPALRTVGNIATGDDKQTDAVVAAGALVHLGVLMRSSKKGVRKEAVWTISNITAGTKAQIEAVKGAGLLPELVRLLETGEWEVKKEAVWAVCNYCSGGTKDQIRFLVRGCNAMKPMCDALAFQDVKILQVLLDAFTSICKSGIPDGSDGKFSTNPYPDMLEECDGLDKIEELQSHSNQKVYEKAVNIIEQFFSEEEQGENMMMGLAPNQSQGGSFQFDAGNQSFGQQPAAGFNFGSPAPQQGGFSFGAGAGAAGFSF